ncbi:MAG: molybdopterin biosynthesis protein [Chloroflexi bacterium]|nr:molybdopterin biosynthesis protein [Chloroflexota bacterium]
MSKQRRYYLEDIPLEEALSRFLAALEKAGGLNPLPPEQVPLEQTLGRVIASPVWARNSSPHYNSAAMDGVAVHSNDTRGASEVSPVRLKIGEQAVWVDTGDPLPTGFDAVIMIEHVQQVKDHLIEIMAPVTPWQHVRPVGEDLMATELVLPENHVVRPVDMGAIAAAGLTHLNVRRRPRVAIIPTGSELVRPGERLSPGKIIEFNSLTLASTVQEWGGAPDRLPIVPDDEKRLKEAIRKALEKDDVVIINAGSSAGSEDFTAAAVAELGEVIIHGIAIRPGHPALLGRVGAKPVIGIPGYPVSAVLTFELLVKPVVYRLLGRSPTNRPKLEATITRKVLSPMGQDEFLRVRMGVVGNRVVATPLQRGAGVITSLTRADGLVLISRFSEGVNAGEKVSVELLRSEEEIRNTIVAIGSHDLTLDLIANRLHRNKPPISLASSNVGSLGGLLALKNGEAHLAGSHLMDESTGEYNVPHVKRLLPDAAIQITTLVHREQGLIVPKGNPRGIVDLQDLLREEVTFVNRQKEAGTRVLLDYKLRKLGISADKIKGYEHVVFTHLAVAAAVASGAADAGLGILAAAKAFDLDFVPLFKERYDLVIPKEHWESPLLQPLLSLLQDKSFQKEAEALGGYDASDMGKIVASLP